jgi:hypothetical protein
MKTVFFMPEISRFFGITVQMYHKDHDPPHFHVRYSGQKAPIAIETVALMNGTQWKRLKTSRLHDF